jgi:hypothetical protein
MKLRHPISIVTAACFALAGIGSSAEAAPIQIPFASNVQTATGAPVTVPVTVQFRLFRSLSGGAAFYSQSHAVTPDADPSSP